MRIRLIYLAVALLSLASTSQASINYYYGSVHYFSPDGSADWGNTASLVKRTILPGEGRITELVTQPDRNDPSKSNDFDTTLTRVGTSNVFSVSIVGDTTSGTMSFSGDEWNWDSWTYDLKLSPSGYIHGTGSLSVSGIQTRKEVFDANHAQTVLMTEDLKPISDQEYARIYIEMHVNDKPACRSNFPKVDLDLKEYDQAIKKMQESFSAPENSNDKDWVKAKLKSMYKIDQYMRKSTGIPFQHSYSDNETKCFQEEFAPRFKTIDAANTSYLKSLLTIYQWIKISEFGEEADNQAWLIVQHADEDPAFQKSILVILEKLWPLKETKPSNYAYLYDRVAASWSDETKRAPQRYGTQGMCKAPSDWQPIEVEDPANLDKRRLEVELAPFAEYKKQTDQMCH